MHPLTDEQNIKVHDIPISKVFSQLGSSEKGLSQTEVAIFIYSSDSFTSGTIFLIILSSKCIRIIHQADPFAGKDQSQSQ